MSAAKGCPQRLEDIVALVMGELDALAARELQDHFAVCEKCRQTRDALAEEETQVRRGFQALAEGLGPIERAVLAARENPSTAADVANHNHFLERAKDMILAHKRLGIAAVAAVAASAAGLMFCLSLFSSAGAAYGLEQTAQANDRVMSYHVKVTPANELGEAWVQLNPDGTLRRARLDLQSPDDGAKVLILAEGKAEMWFKDKKTHIFVPEKDILPQVLAMRASCDPKLLFEKLQAAKRAGKVQVASKAPAREGAPITLTVTPKDSPDHRSVCEVNPNTKLVERMFIYRRQGDQWKQEQLWEFLDYNQDIDPKVFHLDLPKDVLTVDQVNRKPGLVKGGLSDEQIAIKVARQFFEALIAEDYDKAGLMYSGMPAARMKEVFGRCKFSRIVEIGKPSPYAANHSLQVPVKAECEMPGKVVNPFTASVRTTDAAMARKAVREFLEAIRTEDYEKAGRISAATGLLVREWTSVEHGKDPKQPQEQMKNLKPEFERGHVKVARLVEIGPPVPRPGSGTMEVPVQVEFQFTGAIRQVRQFSPFVRPVEGQPDRWEICGGI